ncbi:MAG: NFACT RNA binding domain-containing protein [Sandaracinaceae bacterium]
MTRLPELEGAHVRRVDGPRRGVLALTLRRTGGDTGCLLLTAEPRLTGWGWLEERPRGEPASAFVSRLRKVVGGARLEEARVGSDLTLRLRRGSARPTLELRTAPANIVLTTDEGAVGTIYRPAGARAPSRVLRPTTFGALAAAGPELWSKLEGSDLDDLRRTWLQAVARQRKKLERRERAIEGDLRRRDEVDGLRARGSLLLAHLATIDPEADVAVLSDWDGRQIAIPIDPRRGPRGEADALFRRARKLERGARIAEERLETTGRELEALRELDASLRDARDEGELEVAASQARRLGLRPAGGPSARPRDGPTQRSPYRRFLGADDRPLLVGRTAADNDRLTLTVARPHDLWLHARGVAGSHVVVPLERGEDCPPALLVDAAHLASRFSRAAGEDAVEVTYTDRRYVRKRRGSPPGQVAVEREKVLLLRVEEERMRWLLGRETAP